MNTHEEKSLIKPRVYQREALKEVLKYWYAGITRQLISLPTGCGKTIIFGLVAKAIDVPTLVLAHREELLYQAQQKIRLILPNADTGFLKAGDHDGLNHKICIASVQTAVRHIPELSECGYKLLIVDEAHHAPSNSYKKIIASLGFLDVSKDKLLLGVTATAFRGDSKGLGEIFQKIVFEQSIDTMVRAGYLCDLRCLEINTGEDISCVHLQTGDFAVNELAQVIDIPVRNALIADSYLKFGEGRRGVVFGVKVEHAMHIAEAFRERGIACETVYGEMPSEERADILRRYANHEIQILTNVGVLTEGWDVPDTDIIMMARPTKSKGLYVQCVGRGLRVAPEKKDCLLLDFVDIAKKHKLCNAGTLVGKEKLKLGKRTLLEALEREERFREHEFRDPTIEKYDVFQRSRYMWDKRSEHYRLYLMDGQTLWCQKVEGGYTPLLISQDGVAHRLSSEPLPLDYSMGVCEDYARSIDAGIGALKDASWRSAPATEKQLQVLRGRKVVFWEGITKGEASDLIDRTNKKDGATEKQIKFIKDYGLHGAPELLTKYEAMKIIKAYYDGLEKA